MKDTATRTYLTKDQPQKGTKGTKTISVLFVLSVA